MSQLISYSNDADGAVSHLDHQHALYKCAQLAMLILMTLLSSLSLADEWSLIDKNGVRYTSSGLHGKWVLVNFWAPWCAPCIREIPELVSLQRAHKDLQVIGVAVMYRTKQEVMDIAQSKAVTYPLVLGKDNTANDFGGMDILPTSFLYSPTGKLVGRGEGPLTKIEVEQAITQK